VEAYANLVITNGWMFRNKKEEAERMSFYEQYMFELIQRVQDAGVVAERLLPREEDTTVSHGIARSGRREMPPAPGTWELRMRISSGWLFGGR
jgi:hypothetical protein